MKNLYRAVGACSLLSLPLAAPCHAQPQSAPPVVKLEFRVSGAGPQQMGALQYAFGRLESVQDVQAGQGATFALQLRVGGSLDLNAIDQTIASVNQSFPGSRMTLDGRSVLLWGLVTVDFSGVDAGEARNLVWSTIESVPGLQVATDAASAGPGTFPVRVTAPRPIPLGSLLDMVQRYIPKDPATSTPRYLVSNVTWGTASAPAQGNGGEGQGATGPGAKAPGDSSSGQGTGEPKREGSGPR